jgi:alcohol dehydrogenase (cytochrome c)
VSQPREGFSTAGILTPAKSYGADTIPAPGEPGSETWPKNSDAWMYGGGPTWRSGSYDPELDLVYWGTGNAQPYDPRPREGMDSLFTSSVLALRPKTGEIVCHFQYTPNDVYDLDGAHEHVLADRERLGAERGTSGARSRRAPRLDGACVRHWGGVCIDRAHSRFPLWHWAAASSNDGAGLWRRDHSPSRNQIRRRIRSPGGHQSVERANEMGDPVDRFPECSAGIRVTGGRLVFTGKLSGEFIALDEDTGKTLWQFKTGSSINATAITYTHNDRQYVTIASGLGGALARRYAATKVPTGGSVWTFALGSESR